MRLDRFDSILGLGSQEEIRSLVDKHYFAIEAIHFNLIEKVHESMLILRRQYQMSDCLKSLYQHYRDSFIS